MFPTGWTRQHAIQSDPDKVSGTANLTNFPSLLTEANFNASIFSNSQGKEASSNFMLSGIKDDILQGYYKLEDVTDDSGNSYDLTNVGTTTFTTGKFGNAATFDGSTQALYNSSTALNFGSSPLTYSCWIKRTDTFSEIKVAVQERTSTSGQKPMQIQVNSTDHRVRVPVDGVAYYSTSAVPLNEWVHIAFVVESNTSRKIYVNGVLENTITASYTHTTTNMAGISIGRNDFTSGTGNYFKGQIDDVLILSGALSDAEVKAIYTGGADLRFTTDEAGTNQIPHEVVNWDIDNSEAEVWVKIPTLSYNTATTIYVWANNSSATPVGRELATFNSLYNDANLQGYWRFESSALDETPNNNDLTLLNSPSYATSIFGNGLDLEDSSSQGAYISNANQTGLDITGSQTWSCWFKPETVGGATNHHFLMQKHNGTQYRNFFIHRDTDQRVYWQSDSGQQAISTSKISKTGVWYHLAVVVNTTSSKAYIYINGVLDSTTTVTGAGASNNGDFAIGYDKASSTHYADGIIDDVAVFNRALSADEIAGLYGSGAGVWGSDYKLVVHDLSNPRDSTSNNLSITNTSVSAGTGKVGNGGDYNGSSSVSSLGDTLDPSVVSGTGTGMTLQAWVKPDTIGTIEQIIGKLTSGVSNGYRVAVNSSDEIRFSLKDASDHTLETTDSPISTGAWSHVAARWDKTTMRVQINGAVNSTTTSYSGTPSDNSSPFQIGAFTGDSTYFDGVIDEVRVVGKDLGSDWLLTEYNNQNSPATFWGVPTNYTDELTDTITLADNISRGVTYNRGTVSAITLADNVDRYSIYTRNISTEGSNIILNPSFEDGNIDNWTLNGGGVTVVAKSSTYANSGTYSLRVLSLSPSSSPNGESDYTNVSSSTTYNLSFYCRRDISDSNATYRVIGYDSGDSPTDLISTTPTNTTAGSFVQVTDTFTTASDTVKIKVFLGLTISNGDVFFDDVSVFQEGSDTILVTDNIDYEYTAGTILRSLLSSLTITDNLDRQIDYIREQLSGLTATDTINRQQNSIRDLINTLTLADNIDNSVLSLFLVNLSSSLSISDNIDKTASYSKQLLEAINVAENLVRNVDYSRVLSGSITITDSLDFVNLLSRELTSALSLGDNLDRVLNINVTLSDGISLDDALDIQNTLNRSIESSLILGDNIDATIVLSRSLTSGITVADNLDFTFVINRDLSDTITLTDTIDRVARYIGKSIASIGEIDTIKPTIQGVEKTKGTTYKIDKDRPILYSIRKG